MPHIEHVEFDASGNQEIRQQNQRHQERQQNEFSGLTELKITKCGTQHDQTVPSRPSNWNSKQLRMVSTESDLATEIQPRHHVMKVNRKRQHREALTLEQALCPTHVKRTCHQQHTWVEAQDLNAGTTGVDHRLSGIGAGGVLAIASLDSSCCASCIYLTLWLLTRPKRACATCE